MAFSGQSASNADRLYRMNTKAQKAQVIDDLSARELKDVQLGECKAWNYVNAKGDTICCRYYLPPHFDAAKKYPMVVNYYGGCSPTSRMFRAAIRIMSMQPWDMWYWWSIQAEPPVSDRSSQPAM